MRERKSKSEREIEKGCVCERKRENECVFEKERKMVRHIFRTVNKIY